VIPVSSSSLGLGGLFILAFLGGWFLISIPNQFTNRLGAWVARINTYGFIPKWTFFAPIPGTFDYRLLYRDRFSDGAEGEWQEVDWCPKRRWLHALWHPRHFTTKLIVDSVNGFGEIVNLMVKQGIDFERNPQTLMLSTPYVLLLNLVMKMPRQSPTSVAREMAIFQKDSMAALQAPSDATRMGSLMFVSSAHDLSTT